MPNSEPNMADDVKIDIIDVDGKQRAVIQSHRFPIHLRNWLQTVPVERNGVHYKILASTAEQAHQNYLHAPYQHVYIADVEVVDGDATLGPTEVGGDEQETARLREILSDDD